MYITKIGCVLNGVFFLVLYVSFSLSNVFKGNVFTLSHFPYTRYKRKQPLPLFYSKWYILIFSKAVSAGPIYSMRGISLKFIHIMVPNPNVDQAAFAIGI